jgi:hypothetical protein
MVHPIHAGAQPLDAAGLVAFTPCGHWWVYPVHATVAQLHDVARFNLESRAASASQRGMT